MPGVVEEYVRKQESLKAESAVAEYAGGRYEGIEADVYDYMRQERERAPNASLSEVAERAKDRLVGDIRKYDEAIERRSAPREYSFHEGLNATKSRLEEVYFNNKTNNGWDAYLAKSEPWSTAEERDFIRNLAHSENRFIALAQKTPNSIYATDESYRFGARKAVMQFSHEHNHRLKESQQEKQREGPRMRL